MGNVSFSKEQLEHLYVQEQLSMRKMAFLLDTSKQKILSQMRYYGIPRRKTGMQPSVIISESDIRHMYTTELLSVMQIAQAYGVSECIIRRHMEQYGINYRLRREALQLARVQGRGLGHRHIGKNPHRDGQGYHFIRLGPEDFFYNMARQRQKGGIGRYVLEHRLVIAKHLNRYLLPWEVVHHRNGIKTDNRIENLQLISGTHNHGADAALKSYCRRLERENARLREELTHITV